VWIGEGRDYNRNPDHWLIEVSAFLRSAGQMLEGGGNQWRGMVYGITNRAGWVKNLLTIFGNSLMNIFSEREMVGYWDKSCPIRTDNPKIFAQFLKVQKTS
jgi:hypothetical protein